MLSRANVVRIRIRSLPAKLVDERFDGFSPLSEWHEAMEAVATEIANTKHVTKTHKDNIAIAEYMVHLRELARKRDQGGNLTMTNKKKQTEREYALRTIEEKINEIGNHLAEQAIENVDATEQSAAFSVTVKIEPMGEAKDVRVTASGRITRSTGRFTEHMSIDEQVRMDVKEE